MVHNQGNGPKISVAKLINGSKLTKDDKQMWLGYLPPPPKNLEIQIYYSKETKIGGVKIWNYNKGILDCTKGVYQLQVLCNGQVKWTGQLQPGKGQTNVDYAKAIILKENPEPNFSLPPEVVPETPKETAPRQVQQKLQDQQHLTKQLMNARSAKEILSSHPSDEQEENALAKEAAMLSTQERFDQYRSQLDLRQKANLQAEKEASFSSGPVWLNQPTRPSADQAKHAAAVS